MAKSMFTTQELISMLNLDTDYPDLEKLIDLSVRASSLIEIRTGHDWSSDEKVHPIARDCAELIIKQRWYEETEFHKEYDFSLGITADLEDLKYLKR